MKNRILCLLLVFALMLGICGMLASCNSDNGEEEEIPVNPEDLPEADRNTSKYYEYTWSTKTLNVELSEHSCKNELLPRVKRYLAGMDTSAADPIDEDIRYRNANADKVARTKINWTYLQDVDDYAWGANVSRIANESKNYSDKSADIYINFIYDIVSAQLQGAFANLRSTTMPGAKGKNYFEFTASDYNPAVDDEGYMYDLMNSLSFSTKKMYVLASDYFTDIVRAFFVVPVNIEMINGIDVTMVEKYNYDGNDKFDIEDFFQIIDKNEWNYDAVKVLSAAVAAEGDDPESEMDDTHGFVLGGMDSGIHGVGILYGSDVTVIQRTLDEATGFYQVSYPADAGSAPGTYGAFCDSLASLFTSPGVSVFSKWQGQADNYRSGDRIRELFCKNQVLFGGNICVGNLELGEYQQMNAEGSGFGVAPVPMYRVYDASIDVDANGVNRYYRTASHNIGKAAGISVSTNKFKECSAWLDYQSTHSTDILNDYYKTKLQYGIVGGGSSGGHNVDILEMLRNNVSTALDKCYDDAITNYFKAQLWRWCTMINDNRYQFTDVRTQYTAAVKLKEGYLAEIQSKYDSLPE